MPYLAAHGTMKPPAGAQLDPEHPLTRGLLCAVLFNTPIAPDTSLSGVPVVTLGPGVSNGIQPKTLSYNLSTAPAWVSNRDGAAFRLTTARWLQVINGYGTTDGSWVPLTNVTVCVIRRKVDTTARASNLFGNGSLTTDERCDAYAPYSDGTVYWDFGGQSGANRLTVAGLTFATAPERWIFHAGAAGSAIWQNGVKVASQATAITRSAATTGFLINAGAEGGDEQEFNYFALYSVQWTDDLCRYWSAEPYAHLYARPMTFVGPAKGRGNNKTGAALSAAAAAATAAATTGPLLTTVGVG